MRLTPANQEIVLAHYRSPHHSGLRDPYDAEVRHANATCGDELTLRVRVLSGDGGTVVDDVSYEVRGCSISQASVSVMADLVIGAPVERAAELHDSLAALLRDRDQATAPWPDRLGDAAAFRDVSHHPARIKCVLLGWTALRKALA
ncbi:nitrogen fixation protein NifU [Streptomyces sp. NRRL F-4489]|uniref:Fe-S cluster assembly sulfur transfer protein SufU n=1 Tax=Streptomyces sp. NRRL F-4489 TaxID=1609095 RepID=UPI00074989CF|nr:SUF system NifU family Fe-S cluster assembly protein [Streptomyces sp. NRRL F-4489]KUL38489.1 nitrogen fixation protein NifU [Streptomyces sp. NRRL F-4489]